MPIRSDISSVFYLLFNWAMQQTILPYAANYIVILVVMLNVVQCLFSVFVIRWTSYLHIRVFVSSRVCGILVVEGPLLICTLHQSTHRTQTLQYIQISRYLRDRGTLQYIQISRYLRDRGRNLLFSVDICNIAFHLLLGLPIDIPILLTFTKGIVYT
jgi:hypothetical protein